MTATKSAQDVIEEFVEAIAEQYVAVKSVSANGQDVSAADDFVSAIEEDFRVTLRDRLSQLETARAIEETPTAALSASALRAGPQAMASANIAVDDLGATIDTGIQPHALTGSGNRDDTAVPRAADAGGGTADTARPEVGDTLDSGAQLDNLASPHQLSQPEAEEPTLDTMASDGSQKKATVRPGKSSGVADLSYGPASSRRGAGKSAAAPPDAPDGYQLLSVLGKGGMGIVYKARHVPLNRLVAVKMILGGANATEDSLVRFQREAEAAAHLSHPNIVSVYEVGTHKGLPYFTLEFVDGRSVSELMRETTLTAKDAAKLLIPVARAVQYSHQMGILHRDLKPQNILLTQDGTPKVADFGLAKRIDNEDDEKTREGVILGTPGYMAPEQARCSDKIGPHTDVYALGSILYYLMTGRPPFAAPTPFETVRQLLADEPVAPSRLQTTLDKDLETICLKSLEKDIPKRYATAGEFADELQRFVDGAPIVARPITRSERVWKWCKRNPRVATLSGIAASLLLCLLVGGIVSAVVINEQKKAEQVARRDAETNAELSNDVARLVVYETKDFMRQPELQPLREKLMIDVVSKIEKRYEKYLGENKSAVFAATADRHLGQLYVEAGEFKKAIEKLAAAQKQLISLDAEGKVANAAISRMLITLALGDAYFGIGELKLAETQYLSLEAQKNAEPEPRASEAEVPMTRVLGKLGRLYRALGNPQKSRDYILRSEKLHREQYAKHPDQIDVIEELSAVLTDLSQSYENAGETQLMLAASSEALELKMRVAERDPSANSARRHNLARDQKVIARQYLLINQDEKAKEMLATAASTMEDLLRSSSDGRMQSLATDIYYWQGITLDRMGLDPTDSFARAEELNAKLMEKSDNVNTRGVLLRILARAGRTEEAIELADKMAETTDNLMSCGYAACGYALVSEHLAAADPRKTVLTNKAIDLTRKLIGHGFHDFESLRSTDLDFRPLQQNADYLQMINEEEKRVAAEKKS